MATYLTGVLPGPAGASLGSGPSMGLSELTLLAKAPQRSEPSTRVTVRSFDVLSDNLRKLTGRPLPPWLKAISPDHMYVEYDDGREQYIFRGGPSGLALKARVDPARDSPDYGRGDVVRYQTTLPGQTARAAIGPARAAAGQVNAAHAPYLVLGSNSNSVVGDLTEEQLGHRVGTSATPGYRPAYDSPYLLSWF